MSSQFTFIAILIISGSFLMFSKMLERAHRQLTPEQLKSLSAGDENSWFRFLLPIAPVAIGYVLVALLPGYQAWVAIPAIVLTAVMLWLQRRAAAKRMEALNLSVEFYSARRNANLALIGGVALGAALLVWARFQ